MNRCESVIMWIDIWKFLKKKAVSIFIAAFLFGVFCFVIKAVFPLKYQLSGLLIKTDREGSSVFNKDLKSIYSKLNLEGKDSDSKRDIAIFCLSDVLKPVIYRTGLQMKVRPVSLYWLLKERCLRAFSEESFFGESKYIHDPYVGFQFEDVKSDLKKIKHLDLMFNSRTEFTLFDYNKNCSQRAAVGEKIEWNDLVFTLIEIPKNMNQHIRYQITITPYEQVLLKLKKKLCKKTVLSSKGESICLNIFSEDRLQGLRFLNELMLQYKLYMKKWVHDIQNYQLDYLKQREKLHVGLLANKKAVYTQQLKSNIDQHYILFGKNQLIDLQHRRKSLFDKRLQFQSLLNMFSQGAPYLGSCDDGCIITLQDQLQRLKIDRQRCECALFKNAKPQQASLDKSIFMPWMSMRCCRVNKKDNGNNQQGLPPFYKGSSSSIQKYEEWDEMDVGASQALLSQYLVEYEAIQSRLRSIENMFEHINNERIEWVSLSGLCSDLIAKDLIKQIGMIQQRLRKQRLLVNKESERLENRLLASTKDLKEHINQLHAFETVELQKYKERIARIRTSLVHQIQQEITIVGKDIQDRVKMQTISLKRSIDDITQHIALIDQEITQVVDVWIQEEELENQTKINNELLTNLFKVGEQASLKAQFATLDSTIIELPYGSLIPAPPLLMICGLGGGLIGLVCMVFYYLMRAVNKGFPLTVYNMKSIDRKAFGPLTGQNYLSVFRDLLNVCNSHKTSAKVICMALGSSTSYSPIFAELLTKQGKRVLFIDMDQDIEFEKHITIMDHLNDVNCDINIYHQVFGDCMFMGKITDFFPEVIQHPSFKMLIDRYTQSYDVVTIAIPDSMKIQNFRGFLDYANMFVIKMGNYSFAEIDSYLKWEDSSEEALVFV